jgi:hypothetical protein
MQRLAQPKIATRQQANSFQLLGHCNKLQPWRQQPELHISPSAAVAAAW